MAELRKPCVGHVGCQLPALEQEYGPESWRVERNRSMGSLLVSLKYFLQQSIFKWKRVMIFKSKNMQIFKAQNVDLHTFTRNSVTNGICLKGISRSCYFVQRTEVHTDFQAAIFRKCKYRIDAFQVNKRLWVRFTRGHWVTVLCRSNRERSGLRKGETSVNSLTGLHKTLIIVHALSHDAADFNLTYTVHP